VTRPYAIALAALVAFGAFVVGNITANAPTYDEGTHLTSGISYWTTGDYRLNPEHPPLVKLLAAATARTRVEPLTKPLVDESWAMALANVDAQWRFSEFSLYGLKDQALRTLGATPLFVPTNVVIPRTSFANDPESLFLRARLTLALFGLALGVLVFLWSRELWGAWGGVVSVILFAFDPNFIAHAGLVTTDVAVTLFLFATVYFFWKGWRAAFVIACALAVVTKFSAILLAPILIVLAMCETGRTRPPKERYREAVLLGLVAIAASVLTIWATYRFRYSAAADPAVAAQQEDAARANLLQPYLNAPQSWPRGFFPLRDIALDWSAKKAVLDADQPLTDETFNRARQGTRLGLTQRMILFAAEYQLLPEAFLFGATWVGNKSVHRASYLRGHYSDTGFTSFYLWTTLYKLPMATLLLIALAFRNRVTPFLWVPVVIYLGFSLASNLNIGHRHILPIFPFLYVACGALAKWKPRVVAVLLLATVISTSLAWGRHVSYMNALGGWGQLSDSNFDWGQDLERLGNWVDANQIKEPINLVYFGTANPRWYGFRYHDLRTAEFPAPRQVPGVLAISSADYLGIQFEPARREHWRTWLARRNAKRIGTAGDSIFLYRIE
jgi:Dolichyl-phosphate-mannose-protein mannosyltransferase